MNGLRNTQGISVTHLWVFLWTNFQIRSTEGKEMYAECWCLHIMGRGSRLNKEKRSRINLFLFLLFPVLLGCEQGATTQHCCLEGLTAAVLSPQCNLSIWQSKPSSLKLFPVGFLVLARKKVMDMYVSPFQLWWLRPFCISTHYCPLVQNSICTQTEGWRSL